MTCAKGSEDLSVSVSELQLSLDSPGTGGRQGGFLRIQ